MKKFILLVYCFIVVALKTMAASGPDLIPYAPPGWDAPLVCSPVPGDTTADDTLATGMPTYVRLAVKNVGDEQSPLADYAIMVDGEVVTIPHAYVYLDPGECYVFPVTQFTFNSTGTHTVTGMVDYNEYIDEIDEDNNDFSVDYLWTSGKDLVPNTPPGWSAPLVCSTEEGDTIGGHTLKAGVPTYVRLAVKNVGDERSPLADYAIMVDGEVVTIPHAYVYLDPGECYVFPVTQFTFNSTGVHTVTGMVDYNEYIDEINEGNNDFSFDYYWIEGSHEGVNMYNDEVGIVNISFVPIPFEDPPGDVDDPVGCVFVDNRFLTRLSPEQIEEGHFSYIDNPEMNKYVKDILHDLGPCSLYVFVEVDINGKKYNYSEAAKFDISEDNYQRLGSARVWQELEDYVQGKFDIVRLARHIIETKNWDFTADLGFLFMGVFDPKNLSTNRGEDIYESCSSMEPIEFDEEGVVEIYSGISLPKSFDWRNKDGENWMTSVKTQIYVERNIPAGGFKAYWCGSCYAMGALGAVEAFYNIEMESDPDFDLDLSEMHAVCETPGGGCDGGNASKVYQYLYGHGLVTEDCLPYIANKGYPTCCSKCDEWEDQVIKLSGYTIINRPAKSVASLEDWRNEIKESLLETPLTFSVGYTDDDTFKLTYGGYSGGIFPLFHGKSSGSGHCVVLVGWGDTLINDSLVEYWIVKNSRSPAWGDNGYIKMKMADDYNSSIKAFLKPIMRLPEVGIIAANPNTSSDWHSVGFPHSSTPSYRVQFADPIVVMGPPSSYNDNTPTTVRVKDVAPDSFKFQLDEWDYQDGIHGAEIIPYLIVEKGAHTFGDLKLEARKIEDFRNDFFKDWVTVELKDGFFSETPVILTQVVTKNGEEAVVTRVRNVSTSSFEIMLQEEEGNDGVHSGETVHYIAISPGSTQINGKDFVVGKTPNSVTDDWYTINFGDLNSPVVLANMNTTNGTDPAALRYKNPSNSTIEVKVEEEQSGDSEVEHSSEIVGYVAMSDGGGGTVPQAPSNLDTFAVFPTHVDLTWQGQGSRAGFLIERKEGSGSFSQIGTIGRTGRSYTDLEVEPATTYAYRVRAYNYGGYSDYSNEITVTTLNVYDFFTISVNQPESSKWQQIYLPRVGPGGIGNKYQNPIVVMGPPSCNDMDPTTIRVKDVNYSVFQFQIDEWDYLDGVHGTETISYMVMEEGVHNIDGEIWEAGKIEDLDIGINEEGVWRTVNFESGDFDEPPVIFTQTVTNYEHSAVVTRIKDVTADGFKIRLQEEEGNDGTHLGETVHYIATQAKSGELDGKQFLVSKTGNKVTHEWYNEVWPDVNIESPIFLAGMQTFDGSDPCALRYQNLTEESVEIKCEEERSYDPEVNHATEDIGYLVISGAEPALSTFTTTTEEIKEIYENYIKLVSPMVTGNIVLNVSSNYDRKASVELIDIVGRVVERKTLNLKRGRGDLNLGQFKSGVYFLRIQSDEANKTDVHKITVLR